MTQEHRRLSKTSTTEFILKSGTNKGHRRIWIEKRVLAQYGFTPKTMMKRRFVSDLNTRMILETTTDRKLKKHTVSQKKGVPVIDMIGKQITQFMGDYPRVRVEVRRGRILITPTFDQ